MHFEVELSYYAQRLLNHGTPKYHAVGYNDYWGVFITAPEYPNCRYSQDDAIKALREKAATHNCVLKYYEGLKTCEQDATNADCY